MIAGFFLIGLTTLPGSLLSQEDSAASLVVVDTLRTDTAIVFPTSFPPGTTLQDTTFSAPDSGQSRQAQVIDSIRANSDLQSPVEYTASDSIVFDISSGTLFLYNEGTLNYGEFGLEAPRVEVKMEDETLWAGPVRDSAGTITSERPSFKQGEDTYTSDELTYNFSTDKGRIIGGRMVEGDAYILAEVAKYHEDGSFHGADGKYTTCDADHPHFYIQSRKMKVLDNQQLISGPLNLVIADFPIPVVVPFGFLPKMGTPQGRARGMILPQYGNAQDRGFFLRGLGYYLPINESFDFKIDGDIYTRGDWRVGGRVRYNVRYKYSGTFALEYGQQTFNERTDPDFRRSTAWRLNWSHNQPINPTARISSSVSISSSNNFQRNISYQQTDFFKNNLNSSVSFNKSFNNLPFNLSLSARHQQDLNKETMSLQLPEFSFNVNRQNPFKNVQGKNLNFLRQLGVTYNVQARNSIPTIADTLLWQVLLNPRDTVLYPEVTGGDTVYVNRLGSEFFRNGMQHRASVNTQIKLFNYINISPNLSYNEYWYTKTIDRSWNEETRQLESVEVPGFARGYDFNGGVSANTNFYGIYGLPQSKRQIAFRQRFSPSVGYNIRPDFSEEQWGFYQTVQVDTFGNTRQFSTFSDGIYGGPGSGEQQAMSFSLSSVLEMKYRKKESFLDDFDENEDPFARINVLDNLSLSSSYNFAADSFQLSTFRAQARTSLFNNKINVNGSATLDPYYFGGNEVNVPFDPGQDRRQNRLLLTETGQLARVTSATISMRTSFRSERRGGNKEEAKADRLAFFDQQLFNDFLIYSDEYVDFDVPWTINLSYNLSYRRNTLDPATITQTINASGSYGLTPNWQVRASSGFDIQKFAVTNTSINVYRLLHCWELSFQWVPFGPLKSYSITLNVRNPTLQQLKVSKNNFWQDRFNS